MAKKIFDDNDTMTIPPLNLEHGLNKKTEGKGSSGLGYEEKMSRYKKRRIIAFIVLAVLLVSVGVFFLYKMYHTSFNSHKIIKRINREDSNTVKYLPYTDGLLKYSKDGAAVIDANGNVKWNGTYNMNNPMAVICENYIAVGDIGGKDLTVFNKAGSGVQIDIPYPIEQITVSRQGVAAILAKDGDTDHIVIYNSQANGDKLIYDFRTTVQKDGFPVSISLSMDGSKMVSSYLTIQDGKMVSQVTFYNLGEVGQNMQGRVAGMRSYENILVPKVEFINNDTICVYTENGFALYKMEQKQKLICEEEFDSNIKSVFSDSQRIGFVIENNKGKDRYLLKLYQLSGKKIMDQKINYDYSKVFLHNKEIVFYSELECSIITTSGKEKYKEVYEKGVEYILPKKERNRYLFITQKEIQNIKLMEVKKDSKEG